MFFSGCCAVCWCGIYMLYQYFCELRFFVCLCTVNFFEHYFYLALANSNDFLKDVTSALLIKHINFKS